ncbi:hypothetical protein ACIBU0_07905 [Streptomyces sp. NPDC049627]|uniref:hypothetical protein n=1 Tax=Streptomyces sp. NPDC049627 TaxID=3365595 RepID=UPI0037B5C344
MRKIMTAAGLAASAVAAGVLMASPAAAWTANSQFDVTFPNQRPKTTYMVEQNGAVKGDMTGKSVVYWQLVPGATLGDGTRFTSFKITTRIEERLTPDGEDHVATKKTCDMTEIINNYYNWSFDTAQNTCVAPSTTYDGELYWSSDATIVYDIAGDDKGAITQELQGTTLIHG